MINSLIKTAELLEEAAHDLRRLKLPERGRFSMNTFGTHPIGHKPTLNNLCGTSACAAGWLSLMPKWRERGFTSHWVGVNYIYTLVAGEEENEENEDWDCMAKSVFGASRNEMHAIFYATYANRESIIDMFLSLAASYRDRWTGQHSV